MLLKDLYKRKIGRDIDPVAIVSKLEKALIDQEIDEYYFTDKLIEHLHSFFRAFLGDPKGRTGVWISGYYGSGKSHFLKYIYYCLRTDYRQRALDHFEAAVREHPGGFALSVTPADVQSIRRDLQKVTVDTIMFNIDVEAKQQLDEHTITRVLLDKLNEFEGYNRQSLAIARFERSLAGMGKLDAFKQAIRDELNAEWSNTSNKPLDLVERRLKSVLEIAARIEPSLDVESTRHAFQNPADFSTRDLLDQLREFLADKPADYRLVFMLDEVSQFIRDDTRLLLNLQSIVEEVADKCDHKVWILCTAQQDLSELVDNVNKASYDFGKILGRFEGPGRRLSLESQDADLITKKRVLEKSTKGYKELDTYFTSHHVAIENQFKNVHSLYHGYENKEKFIETYPLVPYHFKLISEVIRSFARKDMLQAGVSNTARSIIGLTHYVAQACQKQAVGYVVPFDSFFDGPFASYLTHLAQGIIDNALRLDRIRGDEFAIRVTRALFMISNLTEDQSIHFHANVENLTLILMDRVDQTKPEMQKRVQEVLDVLVAENVVSVTDGNYRFLGEEEIIVKNEIDRQPVNYTDRLQVFRDHILRPGVNWSTSTKLDGSTIPLRIKLDDLDISSQGDIEVQFLLNESEPASQLAFGKQKSDLVFCLHTAFTEEWKRKFEAFLRTEKYVSANSDQAVGKRLEALNTFKDQNRRLLQSFREWLADAFKQLPYISLQSVQTTATQNGTTPALVYQSTLDAHLRRIYSKRDMAAKYAKSKSELLATATSGRTSFEHGLTPAEEEVELFIGSNNGWRTLREIVQKFSKVPYGWTDQEVVHIVLNLEASDRWKIEWKNEEIDRKTFVEKGLNSQERDSITIHQEEGIDIGLVEAARKAVNTTIFNESLLKQSGDAKIVAGELHDLLKRTIETLEEQLDEYTAYPFHAHLKQVLTPLRALETIRDPKALFTAVCDQQHDLQKLVDVWKQLRDFTSDQWTNYQTICTLVREQRANFSDLEDGLRTAADDLDRYVSIETRPDLQLPYHLKAAKDIRAALAATLDQLRKQTRDQYSQMLTRMKDREAQAGLQQSIVPNPESVAGQIDHIKSLAELRLKAAMVAEDESNYLAAISREASRSAGENRKAVILKVPDLVTQRELKSAAEVDAFIDELRAALLNQVNQDMTVIIG